MGNVSFTKTVENMLVLFGEYDSNQFGKFRKIEIDTDDNPVLEQNFKREMLESKEYKQTCGLPIDKLTTMEKYDALCDENSEFKTIIITFPGPDFDGLMGKKAIGTKHRRGISIVGFTKADYCIK